MLKGYPTSKQSRPTSAHLRMSFQWRFAGGPMEARLYMHNGFVFFQNSYTTVQGYGEIQVFFKRCFSACNKGRPPTSSTITRGAGRRQSKIWSSPSFDRTVYSSRKWIRGVHWLMISPGIFFGVLWGRNSAPFPMGFRWLFSQFDKKIPNLKKKKKKKKFSFFF